MTPARRRVENFARPQGSLFASPAPVDGDALGAAWEAHVDACLRHEALASRAARLPEPETATTQPRYRQAHGRWVPCERGWVDRVVCLDGGRTLHLELKACALQSHPRRWAIPDSLRADKPEGHQARRLARLATLNHMAAVLLGVQPSAGVWDAYLLPVTPSGLPAFASHASATWEELAPYRLTIPAALIGARTLARQLAQAHPLEVQP